MLISVDSAHSCVHSGVHHLTFWPSERGESNYLRLAEPMVVRGPSDRLHAKAELTQIVRPAYNLHAARTGFGSVININNALDKEV